MQDQHVDRPGVEARQRAQLTGPNRPIGSNNTPSCTEIIHRPCAQHPPDMPGNRRPEYETGAGTYQRAPEPRSTPKPAPSKALERVNWTTWWLWRGARTRSHPELGRENPQRPWYCASRHGRVGRGRASQGQIPLYDAALRAARIALAKGRLDGALCHVPFATDCRGVEQPGSSSGS